MSKIESRDMWTLLLCTVRYSLGRSTYMTEYATELVTRYSEHLRIAQLEQIALEIEKELERAEDAKTTLGMEMDHAAWKLGVERIRFIIKHRGDDE